MDQRVSTLSSELRNDLHLTSTGIGHAVKDQVEWPKIKIRSTDPLPPGLNGSRSDPRLRNIYETTTGTEHCYQPSGTLLEHPLYKKAPGHWKVHYTSDMIDKLNKKPWRQALVTGNQCSEMRRVYRGVPETISRTISHSGNPQPPVLADHHTEGPTKGLEPSTVNKSLQGRSFIPQNQAILDRLEPYMTTNQWHHRTFSNEELRGYPKKNVSTYWQCEDYSKAWGHGMKENPLPRKLCRTDPGPMTDRAVFKTRTTISRLPSSAQPIVSGLTTVYSDMYLKPTNKQRQELFHCPVGPIPQAQVPDKTLLETVPHMYKTSSMEYGKLPQVA